MKIQRLSFFSFLPKGSAFRQVSILAGGTVIAQGLTIAITPLLSRIYSPSDFGIMAVFASATAILTEFSGLRYHFAIPLPKEKRYANALINLSVFLQAVFVFLLSLAILLIGEPIFRLRAIEILFPYRFLIPLAVATTGVYNTLTRWAIREKAFSTIANTKITQCVSGIAAKLFLGLLGLKPLGLLVGTIIARGGGISTLARTLLKSSGLPRPEKKSIRRVAIRYRNFPLYETWAGLLNTLGGQIMPLLLVMTFGKDIAGLFDMAQMLLFLPAIFIGEAVRQVFLQRASVARYEGNLKEIAFRSYNMLIRTGFFPVCLLAFFAPHLFSLFLGKPWLNAGYFAMVIAPSVAFAFAYSPMSALFSILGLQRVMLLFESSQFFLRLLAFWLGAKLGGPLLSAALFWGVYFLFSFIKMSYLLGVLNIPYIVTFKKTSFVLFEAIALLALPFIFRLNDLSLITQVTSSLFAVFVFIFRLHSSLFFENQ